MKKIETDILSILKKSQHPISTRELSLRVKRSWHSVNTQCLKLQIKGKVQGYRVSNINLWQLSVGGKK